MNIYEANCKPKQNKRKATIVCLLSVIAYNAMLIFLLEYVVFIFETLKLIVNYLRFSFKIEKFIDQEP